MHATPKSPWPGPHKRAPASPRTPVWHAGACQANSTQQQIELLCAAVRMSHNCSRATFCHACATSAARRSGYVGGHVCVWNTSAVQTCTSMHHDMGWFRQRVAVSLLTSVTIVNIQLAGASTMLHRRSSGIQILQVYPRSALQEVALVLPPSPGHSSVRCSARAISCTIEQDQAPRRRPTVGGCSTSPAAGGSLRAGCRTLATTRRIARRSRSQTLRR